MTNLNLQDYKKSPHPFEEYLKEIHSKDYMGTDDDMPDSFESWITELEPETLIEHANVFSKLLLDLIEKPSF